MGKRHHGVGGPKTAAFFLAGLLALGGGVAIGRAMATSRVDRAGPPARTAATRAVDAHALEALKTFALRVPELSKPDPIRELLREACRRDDLDMMRYCEELLHEWVGSNVDRALLVLDWIRVTGARPELDVLFAALAGSDAFQDARVFETVLALLETDTDGPRRGLAAFHLRSLWKMGPDTTARLVAVARAGPPAEVLQGLAQALGAVMDRDPGASHYADALVALAEIPGARAASLELLGLNDPAVTRAQAERVAQWMTSDADAQVRAAAAAALAAPTAELRPFVLERYESAFAAEGDPYVRHVLLMQAARAGGAEAVPAIERMAQRDPYFEDEARELAALIAREPEWERVWLEKERLDAAAQRTRPWEGCEGGH